MPKPSLIVAILVTLGVAYAAAPAMAADEPSQNPAPQPQPARYSFNRVEAGFLRLDNVSGQVTLCSLHGADWACQAVPEERVAFEREIARLQDEVANLKSEVAALRDPPPPRPPADLTKPDIAKPDAAPPAAMSEDAIKLRADMERARVALEHAWQRLVDIIVTFQKDMLRKG